MPPDGSFKGIGERGEIETFPQLLPSAQLQQIAEMQRGILHFADLWFGRSNPSRDPSVQECQRAHLRAILARALQNPTLEEARLFAGWVHDSNDGSTDTEPLFGSPDIQRCARFMTYDQIMGLDWYECFWPQGLARVVGRSERDSVNLWRRALVYPAVRKSARFISTTLSRVVTNPLRRASSSAR